MITLGPLATLGTLISNSMPTVRDVIDRHVSGSAQMPTCTGANAAASGEKP